MHTCVVCDLPLTPGHQCPAHVEAAHEAAHRRAEEDGNVFWQGPTEAQRLYEGLAVLEEEADNDWPGHGYNK